MKNIMNELSKEEALSIFGGEEYKWGVINKQLVYKIVGTRKNQQP